MKIDTYQSRKKPSYGIVVPAGTNLAALQGNAAAAIASLSPLDPKSKGAILNDIFKGDLFNHLENQIAAEGLGLVKSEVTFNEVLGG